MAILNIDNMKDFGKGIGSITKSQTNINQTGQALAMFALDQFATHSANTDPMDRLVRALITDDNDEKPVGNAGRMVGYLESLANVRWKKTKNKAGEEVYRFVRNAGEDAKVDTPTINWFEWRKARKTTKNKVDPDKAVEQTRKRIATAINEKNLAGSTKRAKLILKALAFAMEHADELDAIEDLIKPVSKELVAELKAAA